MSGRMVDGDVEVTLGDVEADPSSSSAVFHRPEGMSDARWAAMQTAMHKVVTGHYPWCTEHHEDDGHGWCTYEQTAWFGSIQVSSGSKNGEPLVWFESKRGTLNEMSAYEAGCVGSWLAHVAEQLHESAFTFAVTGELSLSEEA